MPDLLLAAKFQMVQAQNRLPAIISDYQWLSNAFVAVGWQGTEAYPDGTLVAQVALFNEFGTWNEDGSVRTPARPFMRPAYAENKPAIDTMRTQVVNRINERKMTPQKALDLMGFRLMTWIQKKIKSNVGPPLRPRTLARKRAAGRPGVTLIDTRRMLDALTYHIYLDPLSDRGEQSALAKHAQASAKAASRAQVARQQGRVIMIRTAKRIRQEKRALRRELAHAQKMAKRKVKREAKREKKRVKKAFSLARKGMAKRTKRRNATEKRQFLAKQRHTKKMAKRAASREMKRAKKAVKRDRAQISRDFRRARSSMGKRAKKASRKQVRGYHRKTARALSRAQKDRRNDLAKQRRADARVQRRDKKQEAKALAKVKGKAKRMAQRDAREARGLPRIQHKTASQVQIEDTKHDQRMQQRKIKRKQASYRKNQRKEQAQRQKRARKNAKKTQIILSEN